jgi:hypothetical protein
MERENAVKKDAKNGASSQARKKTLPASADSSLDHVANMQQTLGNQAVQRLHKSGKLQASLKVGGPTDVYEQEANRAADQVMQAPPVVQTKPG